MSSDDVGVPPGAEIRVFSSGGLADNPGFMAGLFNFQHGETDESVEAGFAAMITHAQTPAFSSRKAETDEEIAAAIGQLSQGGRGMDAAEDWMMINERNERLDGLAEEVAEAILTRNVQRIESLFAYFGDFLSGQFASLDSRRAIRAILEAAAKLVRGDHPKFLLIIDNKRRWLTLAEARQAASVRPLRKSRVVEMRGRTLEADGTERTSTEAEEQQLIDIFAEHTIQ